MNGSRVDEVVSFEPGAVNVNATVLAGGETGTCGPVVRASHSSALYGNKLYVFGGRSNAGETLNSVEIYHPASDRWGQGPSFITARESMLAVSH